mmetsp:Transcript_24100/g.65213  ORF Transcript_24100/g.65213 Transcript_24100/m.65213 type:complete len:306 (-) Transcript_24100:697-1614(-)
MNWASVATTVGSASDGTSSSVGLAMAQAVGLSCTLRLMPLKGWDLRTCFTCSSFSMWSAFSGSSQLPCPRRASDCMRSTTVHTRCVSSSIRRMFLILSSSWGLLPCSVMRLRKRGSEVWNLSFSFGVRSPWRVRATTHSSSSPSGAGRIEFLLESQSMLLLMDMGRVSSEGGLSSTKSVVPSGCACRCSGAMCWRARWRRRFAESDQNFCESLTKLHPFTSHTYDLPLDRRRSKPHTDWPKARTTDRAICFSSASRMTGYRSSLPRTFRLTMPSSTGDLRASACAYSGPMAYTFTSVPSVWSSSS